MIFAADMPSDSLVTLGTAGTAVAGLVAWVLKSAVPSLMTKFGEFLDKQNAAAKEEREAAAAERATLITAHADQMAQMRSDSQQMAANFAMLTKAVADLASEVKAMRAVVGDHPAVAPEPRAKRGQS